MAMQEEKPKKAAASRSSEPPEAVHGERTDNADGFEEEEGPTLRRDVPGKSALEGSPSSPPRDSDTGRDDNQLDRDTDVDSVPRGNGGSGSKATPEHGTSTSQAASHEGHSHSQAAHAHAEHGLSHLTSLQLLLGVFGALIVLTVVTVLVTGVDLGGEGNFIVAMVIATVKASLVMAYFMHLRWDNRLNVVVFLSSFLFVLLFLSLSLTDRKEYQDMLDLKERADALQGG